MTRRFAIATAIALGLAAPAAAQVDLTGEWAARQHEDQPERGGGPEVGEYQGLPINDAARARADAWTASLWTVPEHQCIPHPPTTARTSRASGSGRTSIP